MASTATSKRPLSAQPLLAPKARAEVRQRRLARADVLALAGLALGFLLLLVLTWKKWGNPALDAGAELTTAERVADGALPYRDVRYFYGPLGLYGLAGSFELFGASLTAAFAFGIALSAAIVAGFYALARQWLRPPVAAVCAAMTMAIGFSGTAFNFVLPHSNSATVGLLCLILALLALCRERPWAAGIAIGAAGLTRPEFFGVAAAAALVWLLAGLTQRSRRAVLADALRIGLPALAIPIAVLGAFAAAVGADRLLWENLWPVDFIRVAGFRSQEAWAPLTAASAVSTLGRLAVYGGLLAALVWGTLIWRGRRGTEKLWGMVPPLLVLLALGLLDAALRHLGLFEVAREAVEGETANLTLGMTWLPALAIVAALVTAVAVWRRDPPPLSRSWPDDAALVAVALLLGLRAYDAFNGEASYAPYYAAPLVLLAGILHQRIGARWPQARGAATAALALAAAGLAIYPLAGLYSDNNTEVRTARGTFVANDASAPALQQALDLIDARTEPGEPILAVPSDGGVYFMANRPPATYEVMFLPGLIDSRADERRTIARLEREDVNLTVLSARDFSAFGFRSFGDDYDQLLGKWIRTESRPIARFGDVNAPVSGSYPSAAFTIYERH
jgi:Dolichyl-phosphate-mannose-protein mannosyltransferase